MAADVKMRLRGLMLERFLQRALAEGAELRNVSRTSDREAMFFVTEQDSQKLLKLAERYQLDVAIVGRTGRSRAWHMLRERLSLPIALALAMAFMSLALSRLWLIDLPDDGAQVFAQELSQMGIRPGTPLARLDTREIERALYAVGGDYAFVGARLNGVRLQIQSVRELPEPDLYEIDGARDLVAARDGVVVTLNAFTGEAAVKSGDTVRRGQLLIRGEERVTDDLTHGVCALGEAVARVWVTGQASASIGYEEHIPTGRTSLESELRLMEYSLPLLTGTRFDQELEQVEKLPVGGLFLPLQIVRTRHIETQSTQKYRDEQALKAELQQIAMDQALLKVPSYAEIIDKWVDYSMIEGDRMIARAVVEIHQNIAVSRSALKTGGS
ncbi:sporulation protein YqfD [Eubacteriales bacterium OttesenSCG-928-N13]|nr:sporulation protein YqfD [Eubacteriales bacterium OttesenSCG-928-N13]